MYPYFELLPSSLVWKSEKVGVFRNMKRNIKERGQSHVGNERREREGGFIFG